MKTVHLMGIGGMGMTSLAGLFSEAGWSVQGSDHNIYPPASTELEKIGAKIFEGFAPENLQSRPDLVVVGNVISRDNPEAQELLKSGLHYVSMPEALRENFLKDKKVVVVTGTHGKTTTTSLLAWILTQTGRDPGLFVGGVPLNFGRGYRLGKGDFFILEGDEYDTAFFEKTPKFLHYGADHIVLTSVEFDHADIYKNVNEIIVQFSKLIQALPDDGFIVGCGNSATVKELVQKRGNEKDQLYGFDNQNDWYPDNITTTPNGLGFDLCFHGKNITYVESPLLGFHNLMNTIACIAMSRILGLKMDEAARAIPTFLGVKRRQEKVAVVNGIHIYDDFAHHPTAISETLVAFEPLAKKTDGKLWAVFEPRSNTLRRKVFEEELIEAFGSSDEVVIAPVYQKNDSLPDQDKLSVQDLVYGIKESGVTAYMGTSYDDVLQYILENVGSGDVVVFMSNGSFGGLPYRLKDEISKRTKKK